MTSPKKATGDGASAPSLGTVLEGLTKRRAQLEALDTQITESIKQLEEKLREHISTRVSTVIERGGEPNEMWQQQLAYGRWDNRWQFILESGDVDDDEPLKVTPLNSAPREMRIRVFTEGFIERLIREAETQLDAQLLERERAVKVASNLIKAVDSCDIPF